MYLRNIIGQNHLKALAQLHIHRGKIKVNPGEVLDELTKQKI